MEGEISEIRLKGRTGMVRAMKKLLVFQECRWFPIMCEDMQRGKCLKAKLERPIRASC